MTARTGTFRPIHGVLLFLAVILAIAPGIAGFGPVDRDESRYIQATKQMAETGDYVDIRFQEGSRYKKPVGIYWLQSAAVRLSGQGADAPVWVYRTVSVLGIAAVAVAVAWIGSVFFGLAGGIGAALVLVAIFSCAFEGRIAKTDAALLFASTVAQGALMQIYVAARAARQPHSILPWLFWIAFAVGILIKGPITPMLAGLTITALAIADRNISWLKATRPVAGILVSLFIVAPWLIAITIESDGVFWRDSVGNDLLGKVAQGQESHGFPPGFYVLTFGLYFWPFGFFAITAAMHAVSRLRDEPALRFLFAWYVPFWLAFEVIMTKLPHYVLPAYPALALAAGWGISQFSGAARPALAGWKSWLTWLALFGHVVVSLGLAAAAVALPIYLEGALDPWSVAAAAAVIATGYFGFVAVRAFDLRKVAMTSAGATVAYALIFGSVFPSMTSLWLSPRIAAAVEAEMPCEDTILSSVRFHEPSLVFLVGTETRLTDVAGAARDMRAGGRCAMALVPVEEKPQFLDELDCPTGSVRTLATVDGINISKGERLNLELIALDAAADGAVCGQAR